MKTSVKLLHWIPRVLVILAILFVSMFALDSFSEGRTIWQNLLAFLIHLIPSFILTGILIVAWKWEKTGGIILTVVSILFSVFVFILNFKRTNSIGISLRIVLMVCIPFVLSGILFIISYYKKKKELAGV